MKAILLVRVSTKAQDFDEQEKEIYQMAIKDGYSPENIIPICEKESGIKLSEEERAGLNKMKELIETDSEINCVYCWEVSRIARRKKINFSVLDYLINHKIQLVIKNPSIKLFKESGDIDEGAEIVFTLFSQMAESEMRTKLARWKRTKDANRKKSIYTGGWVLFGYEVDPLTKKYVPSKDAELVRKIFNLYLTGDYSYSSLARELTQTGELNYSVTTAIKFISQTLRNTSYAGLPSSMNGYNNPKTEGNVYPAIVTMDMIERCKEIAAGNITKPKKLYNNYYFGKGLLRCPYCGGIMVAKKNNNTYHCQSCEKGFYIQINIIDSVLWADSRIKYYNLLNDSENENKKQNEEELNKLEMKIETSENNIKKMEERIDAIEYKAYVDGSLTISKADSYIKELNKKIAEENNLLTKYRNDKVHIQQILDKSFIDLSDVDNITDDETRFKIIHQMLDCAFIDKIGNMKYNISIYSSLDSIPNQYVLDTRNNRIYSDMGEFYDKFTSFRDEPRLVEMDCYEQRFKPVRDRAKNRAYNVKYCQEHKEENARRQREYRARKKAEKEQKNPAYN